MTKEKLTKLEKYWILYDVANSAFILLVATIVPIYFNSLAANAGISEVNYLAYWGYAASVATLIVALIGAGAGYDGRCEKSEEADFHHQHDGRRAGMRSAVFSCAVDCFFVDFCHCEGGLFRQLDFLRFHAV